MSVFVCKWNSCHAQNRPYGFFGLMVIVPAVRNVFGGNGSSILTASPLLAMVVVINALAGVVARGIEK